MNDLSKLETNSKGLDSDPVLVKRERIKHFVTLGIKVGYGAFLLALVLFFVNLLAGQQAWAAYVISGLLVLGCVTLAPAIVVSYMVKAAERADRDDSW